MPRRRPETTAPSPALQALAASFAEQRKRCPRQRIPDELRGRAVAAVESGISLSAIIRACGLSWSQVTAWRAAVERAPRRRRRAPLATPSAREPVPPPKVLDVIDSDVGSAGARLGEELDSEFRVGEWRVCVQRAIG